MSAARDEYYDRIIDYIHSQVRELPDQNFIEVLEEVSCTLDAEVDAKREELRKEIEQ